MAAPTSRAGSIPACAGEPSSSTTRTGPTWVYPRVCGGAGAADGVLSTLTGLSPRVRGSHGSKRRSLRLKGSIPACAGEPLPEVSPRMLSKVYPRVCGGAALGVTFQSGPWGLSPRVRGSPGRRREHPGVEGSIPACAGEPRQGSGRRADDRVYPRVCGGAILPTAAGQTVTGLSPRVRGSLIDDHLGGDRRGSIPACAGEPAGNRNKAKPARVYPRVCGGALHDLVRTILVKGLSPRVRGEPGISSMRT